MYSCNIFRPPDIHVGGLMFYHGCFLLPFFIRSLISKLAERNSTISGHVVRSKRDLNIHVRNLGYPFHLQIGGPKTSRFKVFKVQMLCRQYCKFLAEFNSERNFKLPDIVKVMMYERRVACFY